MYLAYLVLYLHTVLRKNTCTYIYIYIYVYFEGLCLTTVVLAPGASEVELGAAPLASLCQYPQASARPLFPRRHRT